VIPLLCAAVLAAAGESLPRSVRNAVAVAAAAAACVISLAILARTGSHDLLHWFGGWHPRHGIAVGIDFDADPFGAATAALAAGLATLALAFSVTYMREASLFFEVLMLALCAAMCGFALTGDLFNMFVWFEVTGVAAYALAGFDVGRLGPVQGAFNFAVTNTVAAYLMLIGIGILYAHTGALNLAQIGATLAGRRPDTVVAVTVTLVMVGFLVRAAAVPFHFWLADAHAVAPAPACVLFSGVLVPLGLFALARVYWTVFSAPLQSASAVHDLLLGIGVATVAVGAVMCVLQRHLKRMLAYSTVSHAGAVLVAIALLGSRALAGAADLVLSHAFLKGALFLISGILLRRFGEIDELRMHGRGRAIPGVGLLFGVAAAGLIGLPFLGTFLGYDLIDRGAAASGSVWVAPLLMLAAGVSAGALLRAGARVFLGWGPRDDPLLSPEPLEGVKRRDASLPVMAAVASAMVAIGIAVSLTPGLEVRSVAAADRFRDRAAYAQQVLHGTAAPSGRALPVDVPAPPAASLAWGAGAAGISIATAAGGLWWRRLGGRTAGRLLMPLVHGLRAVHSGLIGDYVTWLTVGTAVIGAVCVLELR